MIGQTLGSFKIEAELGAGAMGIVYRGLSLTKGERVAIKIISKEAIARNEKSFQRFIREIDVLEKFKHPNIVRYRARGRHQGIYYYAMEYVEGTTLDDVIKTNGPLPWDEAVRYAIQLCSALEYAHEKSVIHRDLKPSNLMITKDNKLKLADFGIAKDIDATALTADNRTLGTAAYMSPEQVTGSKDISHKSDLYSLGVVLYEMLTGETPFKGESFHSIMMQHMQSPPPRPSAKTEIIPVALDDLVIKLMAKTPSDRPHDAAFVAMKLEEMLERAASAETLPMVWPEVGSPGYNPTREHMFIDEVKAATKSPKKKTRRVAPELSGILEHEHASLVGMVLSLILIGSVIGYLVWPPSAAYLFTQGEKLMSSPERTDWILAEERFLDPLDRRFPDHPYRPQTDAWHDKVALTGAIKRAELIRNAKTDAEELYVAVNKEAAAATDRFDEIDAAKRWREMEKKLDKKGRDERGWSLLARQRAEGLEKQMASRKATVIEILQKAEDFDRKGASEAAASLRKQAIDQYGKFTDVAELLALARTKIPPDVPR